MRKIASLWPLLAVFALSGCEISEMARGKVVAPIAQNRPEPLANPAGMPWITYRGGDGSTRAKAIVISGAHGEPDGVQSEYDWLAANRPGWNNGGQALVTAGGKPYDVLTIRKSGRSLKVYFDISGYFGRN